MSEERDPLEGLGVRNPTMEEDSLLDSERSRKLLKVGPLRAVAKDSKVGEAVSQERSRRAQRKVARLARHEPSNKNELKLVSTLRAAQLAGKQIPPNSVLWNIEHFVAVSGNFSKRMR